MMDNINIRTKIFGWLLIFCAFLIALLWLFQIVFLESIYKQIKISEVKSSMNTLLSNLNSDELNNVANNIFETRGINVDILSNKGIYISLNQSPRQKDSVKDLTRLFSLTIENNGEYFEYPVPRVAEQELGEDSGKLQHWGGEPWGRTQGPQNIFYCKIADNAEFQDTLIVLSTMISPIDATVDTLKAELYFITGTMVLFSIGLALLIARRVSKPIISINESAKTLAQGNYDTLFTTKGYREVVELADTLNITARELSTVEEMRRELMANVSHDLRTPLTLIAGYAEAMRDLPGENTPENAQIIMDEAIRLNKLVSEVLNLSKLQSGATQIYPAAFNLTQSLRGIVERLSEFTKANGYNIMLEAEEDISITADESAVSQVIYNLLTNAINFTGNDKTIMVRQIVTPDNITVEVRDTGKGILKSELPYIWDRYYRTGKKHKRAVIGTGIGLSIVKSIMDLHGGEYGVRSEQENGSIFWIRFKRETKCSDTF
ncbi:MAG: HAMP domain-containing histidine kinase [Clostridiales bacterium]|jgi:signal transduction histidine kinase|nr:HAMP domain-containing histidine kinase [Clostridiales bacterium]